MGLTALNDEELVSVGPLLAKLSMAISEVTGAEKVYVVAFGENFPHWHFVLMTRGPQVPKEHRGAQLILSWQQYEDRPVALEVAEKIRRLLTVAPTASRTEP